MKRLLQSLVVLATLVATGCGLENLIGSAVHSQQYARPHSAFTGTVPEGVTADQLMVTDGTGNKIDAFAKSVNGTTYELELPSSKYQWLEVWAVSGQMALRAIVPQIGPETEQTVNIDARSTTEALLVEAKLSAQGKTFKQLTPDAYLGTRALIQAAFDQPGPTQDLLNMANRIMATYDPSLSVGSPSYFNQPVLDSTFKVTASPLDSGFLLRSRIDYTGDGKVDTDSAAFDTLLAQEAAAYKPEGCPDPNNIRVVFTVDFNDGAKNGVCGSSDRFTWATNKPGKTMYFVGWVHKDSAIQDPAVNTELGASVPNTLPMYDDGTNGDEVAGDHIYTITFSLPRGSPGNYLRIGYKYTWGTQGAVWTGSEEWPGNSRILEVADENGDGFVYRRDVFGDEASNKDNGNLNPVSGGSITWTTVLSNRSCGQPPVPEVHENLFDNNACGCDATWSTPKGIGPLTVACTGT